MNFNTSANRNVHATAATSVFNETDVFEPGLSDSAIVQNQRRRDEKVYTVISDEDVICYNSIIVVMDENLSNFSSSMSNNSSDVLNSFYGMFSQIGATSIVDLAAAPTVSNYSMSRNGNGAQEVNMAALEEHFNYNPFQSILHIGLNTECRQNVIDTVRTVEGMAGVIYVGPNRMETGLNANPNDPRLSEQWGLIGSNGINARGAWGITPGSRNVSVGVIDSGIQSHNDLNANVDFNRGGDFYNRYSNGNPRRPQREDIGGHGTSTAGVIGAVGDNGIGISGVAQRVTMVPMQTAFDTRGAGNHWTNDMISAITYARNAWGTSRQIEILNFSISGFGTNTAMVYPISRFPGLFVWSAGNHGDNIDNFANASQFRLPNLISVGAHDQNLNRRSYSGFGANSVDIFAPSGILSTYTNNRFRNYTGTSSSAPMVAGVAALMQSIRPDLTAATKRRLIMNAVDRDVPSSIRDYSLSGGRLNAFQAVRSARDYGIWTIIQRGKYHMYASGAGMLLGGNSTTFNVHKHLANGMTRTIHFEGRGYTTRMTSQHWSSPSSNRDIDLNGARIEFFGVTGPLSRFTINGASFNINGAASNTTIEVIRTPTNRNAIRGSIIGFSPLPSLWISEYLIRENYTLEPLNMELAFVAGITAFQMELYTVNGAILMVTVVRTSFFTTINAGWANFHASLWTVSSETAVRFSVPDANTFAISGLQTFDLEDEIFSLNGEDEIDFIIIRVTRSSYPNSIQGYLIV